MSSLIRRVRIALKILSGYNVNIISNFERCDFTPTIQTNLLFSYYSRDARTTAHVNLSRACYKQFSRNIFACSSPPPDIPIRIHACNFRFMFTSRTTCESRHLRNIRAHETPRRYEPSPIKSSQESQLQSSLFYITQ